MFFASYKHNCYNTLQTACSCMHVKTETKQNTLYTVIMHRTAFGRPTWVLIIEKEVKKIYD